MKLVNNSVDGFLIVNGMEISNILFFSSLKKDEQEKLCDAIYQMAFKLQEYEETDLEPVDIMRIKYNVEHMYKLTKKEEDGNL